MDGPIIDLNRKVEDTGSLNIAGFSCTASALNLVNQASSQHPASNMIEKHLPKVVPPMIILQHLPKTGSTLPVASIIFKIVTLDRFFNP